MLLIVQNNSLFLQQSLANPVVEFEKPYLRLVNLLIYK